MIIRNLFHITAAACLVVLVCSCSDSDRKPTSKSHDSRSAAVAETTSPPPAPAPVPEAQFKSVEATNETVLEKLHFQSSPTDLVGTWGQCQEPKSVPFLPVCHLRTVYRFDATTLTTYATRLNAAQMNNSSNRAYVSGYMRYWAKPTNSYETVLKQNGSLPYQVVKSKTDPHRFAIKLAATRFLLVEFETINRLKIWQLNKASAIASALTAGVADTRREAMILRRYTTEYAGGEGAYRDTRPFPADGTLHEAAGACHIPAVLALLKKTSINQKDENGFTPLSYAFVPYEANKDRRNALVLGLLQKGADPNSAYLPSSILGYWDNSSNNGYPELRNAPLVFVACGDVLRQLLAKGANANARFKFVESTPAGQQVTYATPLTMRYRIGFYHDDHLTDIDSWLKGGADPKLVGYANRLAIDVMGGGDSPRARAIRKMLMDAGSPPRSRP